MDAETITIAMDQPTAHALRHLLHEVGEHWAAGTTLLRRPFNEMEQLGTVLRMVDDALGADRPTGWRDAAETRLVPEDPADPETDLARALTDLGTWLTKTGQRHRGLIAFEAARRLDAIDPAAYKPHLARSLSNLGVALAEVRRRDEALTAVEEAVAIYRRRAADDPAYEPHLARFLVSLGSRLLALGRHSECRRAAKEI